MKSADLTPRRRLFAILWLAGFVGVLSLLLLDIDRLLAILPLPPGQQIPSRPVLKLLSVVQPAVLLTVAVAIGVALAAKVRLSAPAAEALAKGDDVMAVLKPQIVPGLIGGFLGGTVIVLTTLATQPFLPPAVVSRIAEFGQLTPVSMRLLYGGITEEVLLRWGLMTLLVWLFRGRYVLAILISSLVFGIGHLPIAFLLFPKPTAVLIAFVIVANSIFGVIAGVLYWKRGLESAIVAHMVAHVVMLAANAIS